MYAIYEIYHAFHQYSHSSWAFTGQTAIKLHSAMLLHKKPNIGNIDIAIKMVRFPVYHGILVHLGFKPMRMMRNMYVFKRGPTVVKLHLFNELPRLTSYDNFTKVVSLNQLSKRNKNVQKMNRFSSTVKRRHTSLNNVD